MFNTGNGLNPAAGAGRPDDPDEERCRNALLKAGALQNAILTSANFSIIATDERGIIQLFNGGAERMLGYASAEVVNRISPSDIHDPQEVLAHARAVSLEVATPVAPGFEALAFKASRGIEDVYELTYIRKDGSRFPAMLSVTALRDEDGQIIGYLLIGTDITQRKVAEEDLRKNEWRLRYATESARLTYVEADLVRGAARTPENFAAVMGYAPPSEQEADISVGTRLLLEHVVPEDRLRVTAAHEEFLAGTPAGKVDYRVLGDDQVERWIETRWSVEFARDGKPLKSFATNLDITERKHAEQKIRESEARYRALFNSIDDGFCIIEKVEGAAGEPLDFRYAEANPAFAVHSGASDVIGKTIRQAFPNISEKWYLTYDTVLRTGEPIRFERSLHPAERVLELYAFRVEDETHRRVAIIFKDITEHRRTEMHLALLASVSQDLSHLTSVDEMMRMVGAKLAGYLNLSLCAFVEISEAADRAVISHDWHRQDVPGLVGVYRLADFVAEAFIRAARMGEIIVVRDTAKGLRTDPEKFSTLKIASFVCAPLVRDGQWPFALCLYKSEPYDWREDELALIREVTLRIWTRLERLWAEEALRDSEERYRSLFDSMDEGYCVLEMIFDEHEKPVDYRFLEVNSAFEEQSGMHDATGKRIRELVPDIEEYWIDTYGKVALTGEPIRYVNEAKTMDSSWFDVNAFRLGGPKSRKVAVLFRNIKERKDAEIALRESEERYRNLFTSIDEGFCVIEMIFDEHDKPVDYRFLEVNPTFGKQTGLLEATGKRMRELVPDLEEHWFEMYGKVALTGESIRFVNEAKPMQGRWFDVYACRVGGPESRKVAIVFDDITKRKQSEEALRQSHVQLQLHSAELGRFNRVAVGRELRMIELKKEINELCLRHGVAARYALDFEQDKETVHG